ncbi:MAG: flavodoxin family protein [Methanomassiliicoccales archaeon]|nr:flavodoxin family protein [Methanomassiliicoccales archaeon]
MKCSLVLFSYHHNNTRQIAEVLAKVLDADIKAPEQVVPEALADHDLIGFGSGIYDGKNHPTLLDLADRMPHVTNGKAFIFSTCGGPGFSVDGENGRFDQYPLSNHSHLRAILRLKGYDIIDEFACAGFNTNSFLRYFGGLNKGRPNAKDLKNAEAHAHRIKRQMEEG